MEQNLILVKTIVMLIMILIMKIIQPRYDGDNTYDDNGRVNINNNILFLIIMMIISGLVWMCKSHTFPSLAL